VTGTASLAMRLSVLIVEDDRVLAATIAEYLAMQQVVSDFAEDGVAALTRCAIDHYDVVLLDLNLPRLDGLEVCKRLRSQGADMPVLMITARDTIEETVAGLEAGADDYVVKPFSLIEVLARIRALANRRRGRSRFFVVGDLEVCFSERRIVRAGNSVVVGPIGWLILEVLIRASPQPVSRDTLLRRVWGDDLPDTDNLKVQLFKLRQAIDKPFRSPLIHTIAGTGYCLREG